MDVGPEFQPRLRDGLRFENGGERSIVRVVDRNGHQHQMYELECLIAKQMDGTRTVEDLAQIGRRYLGTIRADQVAKLVRQLAGMGLLANLDPPARPVSMQPPFRSYADDLKPPPPSVQDDDADDFGTDDTNLIEEPAKADDGGDDDEWELVEPPPDDDDDLPPPSPLTRAPSAPAPAVEWKPEPLAKWYQRPAFRRARLIAIAAAVSGILAVVEYPLYVTEECLVLSGQRSNVRTQVDGLLHEITVDEGDVVKQGDVIARLDPRETEMRLEQARAEVVRLRANLQKAQQGARPEEVESARAALAAAQRDARFAKREAERKAALFKQGLTSAEQRDMANRDWEIKRSAVAQAEAELKLVQAGSREEEVAMAEAELRRAEVEVENLGERRKLLEIKAPVGGQITTPRFKERLHEHVAAGDTICEIADTQSMDVEISVPEREIDSITVGLPVVVKVASYPLHPLEGKVSFIAPSVMEQGGERVVRVLTQIQNPSGILRQGMSGYAEINAGKHSLLSLAFRRVIRWVRVRFLI